MESNWKNLGTHYQTTKPGLFGPKKVDVHITREGDTAHASMTEGRFGTYTEGVYFGNQSDEVILSKLAQRSK